MLARAAAVPVPGLALLTPVTNPAAPLAELARALHSQAKAVVLPTDAGATSGGSTGVSESTPEDGTFHPWLYFARLRNHATGSGRALLYAAEMESTQTLVLESGVSPDQGLVCVADRQSKGRGRGENTWDSPPGCLMFSFRTAFPAACGSKLPLFQYVVSLAAVRASRAACAPTPADVRIKWPNDVYADAKLKIGGVLCQSHHDGGRFVVTTGVGINVGNERPTTCLSTLAARPVRREVVLAEFFNNFDELYFGLFLGGRSPVDATLADVTECSFEPLLSEYHRSWLHDGQLVSVDDGKTTARIEGVSPTTGALLARDANDPTKRYELQPDGNRLDFFKGLVSRRIAEAGAS